MNLISKVSISKVSIKRLIGFNTVVASLKYDLIIRHVPATIRHVNRESRGTACRWGLERVQDSKQRWDQVGLRGIKGDQEGASGSKWD